ncbi:hypothetical protein RHBI111906_11150 [Rhodothermus bifroesti]
MFFEDRLAKLMVESAAIRNALLPWLISSELRVKDPEGFLKEWG